MLTADGEKSKSPKRAKVRFLLATLTYIYEHEAIQKPISENNIGAPQKEYLQKRRDTAIYRSSHAK